MKDRRTIAAILAAALTLTMCGVSAVAAIPKTHAVDSV